MEKNQNNSILFIKEKRNKILIGLAIGVLLCIISFFVYDKYFDDKCKNSDECNKQTDINNTNNNQTNIYDLYDEETKKSIYRESAISIINVIRQQITSTNNLREGYYYFTSNILDVEKITSPLGGTINYAKDMDICGNNGVKISDKVCMTNNELTCSPSATSFIKITNDGTYTFSICLTAGVGNKYIDLGTEIDLLSGSNDVFK